MNCEHEPAMIFPSNDASRAALDEADAVSFLELTPDPFGVVGDRRLDRRVPVRCVRADEHTAHIEAQLLAEWGGDVVDEVVPRRGVAAERRHRRQAHFVERHHGSRAVGAGWRMEGECAGLGPLQRSPCMRADVRDPRVLKDRQRGIRSDVDPGVVHRHVLVDELVGAVHRTLWGSVVDAFDDLDHRPVDAPVGVDVVDGDLAADPKLRQREAWAFIVGVADLDRLARAAAVPRRCGRVRWSVRGDGAVRASCDDVRRRCDPAANSDGDRDRSSDWPRPDRRPPVCCGSKHGIPPVACRPCRAFQLYHGSRVADAVGQR